MVHLHGPDNPIRRSGMPVIEGSRLGLFTGRSKSIFSKLVTGSLMTLMSSGFIWSESCFYKFKFESGYLKKKWTELYPSPYKNNFRAFLSFRLGLGEWGKELRWFWRSCGGWWPVTIDGPRATGSYRWRAELGSDGRWRVTVATDDCSNEQRVTTTIFLLFFSFCKNENSLPYYPMDFIFVSVFL